MTDGAQTGCAQHSILLESQAQTEHWLWPQGLLASLGELLETACRQQEDHRQGLLPPSINGSAFGNEEGGLMNTIDRKQGGATARNNRETHHHISITIVRRYSSSNHIPTDLYRSVVQYDGTRMLSLNCSWPIGASDKRSGNNQEQSRNQAIIKCWPL